MAEQDKTEWGQMDCGCYCTDPACIVQCELHKNADARISELETALAETQEKLEAQEVRDEYQSNLRMQIDARENELAEVRTQLEQERQLSSLLNSQIRDQTLQLERAQQEVAEYDYTFDLRWKADMRAIERWRKEKPEERKLTLPDHADLGVWLLERVERYEAALREIAALWYNSLVSEPIRIAREALVEESKTETPHE